MNATLCVTIRKGTKEYTLWGIRHVEKKPSYLYIYTADSRERDGKLYLVKNAKIVDAWVAFNVHITDENIATLERLEKA